MLEKFLKKKFVNILKIYRFFHSASDICVSSNNFSQMMIALFIFRVILKIYLKFKGYRGDKDAIEQVAYELCEDEAQNGVIYFEARYSPHLLCNTVKNTAANSKYGVYMKKGQVC